MIVGKAVATIILIGVLILVGIAMFGLFKGPSVNALHPTSPAYDMSILRSAPNWTLPLDWRGSPFGEDEAAFAARMAAMMETPIQALTVRLSPTLDPSLVGGHRIAAAFSDKRGRVQDACNPPAPDYTAPAGATLYLNAALCRGDKSLTAASGRLKEVSGINDERLPDLARHVIRALFPRPTRD